MREALSGYWNILLFIATCTVAYFPVFLHLDYMPFRLWDESIVAANAIEMLHNHNYLVSYFNGTPDMQNCKPPLMLWLIVFFSKICGFSELSVRLPSAIAAGGLCVYLFRLTHKYVGDAVYGFITVAVLVSCQGYIRNHVTRTGEYDSLLVLFSTAFSFNLFLAIEANDAGKQSKHLFMFFVFITLAVLTKGIAPIMQVPGLLVYTLINKRILLFLKDKAFYAGLAFFILFGLGFYFLRESVNPGYLKAVWDNELGGRFGSDLDGHGGGITFYLQEIVKWQFISYMFVFPIALLAGLTIDIPRIRRLVTFASCTGSFFLLSISLAGTKLPHYDAPLFPYLAIITAAFFYLIYLAVCRQMNRRIKRGWAYVVGFLFIAGLLARPYDDIISKVYFPKGDSWEENFSVACRYFQAAARGEVDVTPYKLVFNVQPTYGAGAVLMCYKEELQQKGYAPQIIQHNQLKPRDKAIVFDPWIKHLIEVDFEVETKGHLDFCNADVIQIGQPKIKT